MPGVRRLDDGVRDAGGEPGFLEHLGEPRGLIGGDDDPRLRAVRGAPALDRLGDPGSASRRELRFAPSEQVSGRLAAARDGVALLGFPGQLERPRAEHPALPVARREQRGGPVLWQLAGREQVGAPFVRLAPQELAGLAEVAGLVEHEQGLWREVIERGRGCEERGPHLRRVTDGGGARFASHPAGFVRADEPLQVLRKAFWEPLRHCAEAPSQPIRAALGHEELRRREQHDTIDLAGGSLIRRVERPQ